MKKLYVGVCVTTACMLIGCGGGSGSQKMYPIGEEAGGLQVSLPDYRFGSHKVGDHIVQPFTLSNVGVDTYPINQISVKGRDAQEFIVGDHTVVLEPGESFRFEVHFKPLSAGQKLAELDLDYDTITGEGSLATEQIFYTARALENDGDYVAAAGEYRRYINEKPSTANKVRAMTKVPVLEEADIYGLDQGFDLYVQALNSRDNNDSKAAVVALEQVMAQYPNGYLGDDALYMLSYIQMNDFDDYEAALISLQRLLNDYPDTSYFDTAMYSKGLALAEMGKTGQAGQLFRALQDRHTAIDFGMYEMRWPKDTYLSRLWFEKTAQELAVIE